MSLPAWGARIEISPSLSSRRRPSVAPRVGAGSEIGLIILFSLYYLSLPAWGAD